MKPHQDTTGFRLVHDDEFRAYEGSPHVRGPAMVRHRLRSNTIHPLQRGISLGFRLARETT